MATTLSIGRSGELRASINKRCMTIMIKSCLLFLTVGPAGGIDEQEQKTRSNRQNDSKKKKAEKKTTTSV